MTKTDIEQQDVVPMAAKKVWNVLRVLYLMLRKEISRRKLLSDPNLTMKCGKISSLMTFSHHDHATGHNNPARASSSTSSATAEYEFSCRNSPAIGGYNYPQNYLNRHFFSSLHLGGKHHGGGNHFHGFFGCAHLPKTAGDDEDEAVAAEVASFGFDDADRVSEVASPKLPGFGKTPLARQLRITDSLFPLKDNGDGGKIDKAAEEFIQKFYRALQNP